MFNYNSMLLVLHKYRHKMRQKSLSYAEISKRKKFSHAMVGAYSNTRSCANITRKIKNLCFHNTTNFRVGKMRSKHPKPMREKEGAWRNAERIQNPELHTSIHEDDKQTSRTIFYPLSDTSRASTTMCLRVTLGKIIWISLMSSSKK